MIHFDPSFFVGVAFVLFVGLIARPVGRFIGTALDGRAAAVRAQLDEAGRLRAEAQALLSGYRRKQEQVREEAEEMVAHARLEAERILTQAKDNLDRDLAKRTEMVLQKIAQAESSVVREIRDQAVDITISAARRLIMDNLAKEDADDIVKAAIGDINQKLH